MTAGVWLDLAWTLLALGWWGFTLGRLRDLRYVRPLPVLESAAVESGPETISVIVPARNEGARLAGTLERLLAQTGVDLQVIVVDDRSDDGTAERLGALARTEPRLQVVRVDELPAGWMGKPHACHVGSGHARGDWILFMDADVWLDDNVLARSLNAARRDGADHVTLFPGEDGLSFPIRAAQLNFAMGMLAMGSRVNRDQRFGFIGIGAFNLVRRERYHAFDGHRPLRFEVVDDMKLGLLVRLAGGRSRVYAATRELKVQWAGSIGGLIVALEKNYFAGFDYSLPMALAAVSFLSVAHLGALAGAVIGGVPGWLATAGLASSILPAAVMARHTGGPWWPALLTPLTGLVQGVAVAWSAWSIWSRGGVVWRETFYPLAELRAHRVSPWMQLRRRAG